MISASFKKGLTKSQRSIFSGLKNSRSRSYSTEQTNELVELSYSVFDKYNSKNALVIAHGLFASKMAWRSVARRINELTKQKVYTVDLRNHGDTEPYVSSMNYNLMANDLNNFLKTVVKKQDQINKVSVLGHSMGGKTAMTLALNYNEAIDKLIVADITPYISPSTANIGSFLAKMDSIDMTKLDPSLHKARKEVDSILCELPVLKNDVHQRQFLLSRLATKDSQIAWNFNLKTIINHMNDIMSFPEFDTQFKNPTLFLGGELSNYITEKHLPHIERYFTNYSWEKVPKAGHVIHFDNPTSTINFINEFIN